MNKKFMVHVMKFTIHKKSYLLNMKFRIHNSLVNEYEVYDLYLSCLKNNEVYEPHQLSLVKFRPVMFMDCDVLDSLSPLSISMKFIIHNYFLN